MTNLAILDWGTVLAQKCWSKDDRAWLGTGYGWELGLAWGKVGAWFGQKPAIPVA